MNVNVVSCIKIILVLPVITLGLELGEPCTTPNGENATCILLSSCDVLLEQIKSKNATDLNFFKESQCGYKDQLLVCCGSTAYPVNVSLESTLLPDKETCGFQEVGDRVLGGNFASLEEFPWTALLGYKYKDDGTSAGFKCGGSLINSRYVMTAAHCVAINPHEDIQLDIIRLGEWRISTESDCEVGLVNDECADPVVDLKIEKCISHPDYNRRGSKNDIALLRLESNVKFTAYIRPVCLPTPNEILPDIGTRFTAVGWGVIENGSASDIKMKVELPLLQLENCAKKLEIRRRVTENQICVGGEHGKDTCQGDSGGPLLHFKIVSSGMTQWFQQGIVSYGAGCGKRGFPGIYTRVSKYIDWILENMEEF